jgi:hypothetical protein
MAVANHGIGTILGGGRYTILGRIGQGNMGEVFLARDDHLGIDVVIKFPVSPSAPTSDADFLERFDREMCSLIRLSHPHVVKVIDVGRHDGHPYIVMQHLAGGSLKDRAGVEPDGRGRPMPAASLAGWLLDVARALDFIHGQGFVHRDVKPANILFDGHGNAFIGDFGIIKALATVGDPAQASGGSLTAPGFLLGTPNYVAPEVVMGGAADGRADQYALAMTVHEVLAGTNVMAGPSPSATVVNQMNLTPPPLTALIPGVPARLSYAVQRGLEKDPARRFGSCTAFAREALYGLAYNPEVAAALSSRSGPEEIPVLFSADPHAPPDASAETALAGAPGRGRRPWWSRRRALAVAAGLTALILAGVFAVFWRRETPPLHGVTGSQGASSPAAGAPVDAPVTVNIVYGTEKQAWLEMALAEYRKRPEGRGVTINLIGMGSVEGAQAVLAGEKPVPVHVWSPASSAYRDVFESEWRVKYGGGRSPIGRAENLALTPMVFVLWKERYEAFVKKYGKVTFRHLAEAVQEPTGWGAIAGKPEWGVFKFAHTHPNKSNSGFLSLVLMAYEFSGKHRGLTLSDITDAKFQAWLRAFERGVTRHGGSLTHSTGTMTREMVLRGPSQYDCLVLYENLAVDNVAKARDRWGDLYVAYPEPNLWNDHPYYVLDAPWCGPAERAAAGRFLDFLLTEPVQRQALEHGFRPGNPAVPVRSADSPLVRAEAFGVRIDVPPIAEPPRAEVVDNLLSTFQRIEP